ncbi:hypothetical protein [Ekhidna sp.]
MSNISEDQIEEWLKKLERESWQLELLVSAFTIFLLIGANSAFREFLYGLNFKYNLSTGALSIFSIFLIIIKNSIQALAISLIIHLMLRGFWIGTIGLRSVQATVDFEKLNYNKFFTEKLKKNGVISLDKMVVQLDEICSVIFAFSFLIISVLIAFGMYLVGLGVMGFIFSQLVVISPDAISSIVLIVSIVVAVSYMVMGFIYMIDYLTLGFFKRIKWFARIYYPFYRLFNFITLSRLSKSIYYYLISKFSKGKIRLVFSLLGGVVLLMLLVEFDQHQYFPDSQSKFVVQTNAYDDTRPEKEYVSDVSIPSKFINEPFFPLFLRYNPSDNSVIQSSCPDFVPLKDDGLNSRLGIGTNNGGFQITNKDYSGEDFEQLLSCHASIYQIAINDSIYSDLKFRFYIHPHKDQKGLITVIPTVAFNKGENVLAIKKVEIDTLESSTFSDFVQIPFWFKD